MNIRLLEPAQAELDEAIAWYAEQAQGWVMLFWSKRSRPCGLWSSFPKRGTRSPLRFGAVGCGAFPTAWSTRKMAQTFWCSPSRTSTANPVIGSIGVAEQKRRFGVIELLF